MKTRRALASSADPLWYKDAVIYEVHVRAFHDTTSDGVGDFRGLTQKLDYLDTLGVTALWLLPFYPSPLRDDGYDIADYTGVHPSYGTLREFKEFLDEAHSRGMKVITEMVLNHTSDQHPWFQRARLAPPGSSFRNYYVWSDTPDRYREARVIFKDFVPSNWAWDPVAKAYYWHRFYAHQPDLNYDNPSVRRAVLKAVDFWLQLGVDGLRLDAIPYLYEREGTNCENLPETHEFLKTLRAHVDSKFKNRMLLSEANQWPEDAQAYFGSGDESHMAFHFPLMPRLFMGLRMEDRFPIVDIVQQTPAIPSSCQWALFLRNHDELTLEMVTDEERDYMYRVYGRDPLMRVNLGIRRRLAPLLGNDRRKVELLNGLMFSLPGTPVIYYGDEIGMGDNYYLGDRNGVRTPMQWSVDRNAGFSRANPQQLYLPAIIDPEYHYETVNVEAQEKNPTSLLWWMKRLISIRKRFRAFSRGSMEFVFSDNRKVLAFVRKHEGEQILIVANLSRSVQAADLDLSVYKDMIPVELFGRTRFPVIKGHPFFLTLAPYSFYWFTLEPQTDPARLPAAAPGTSLPTLAVAGTWEVIFDTRARDALEAVLPDWLRTRRWFGGKARTIQTAHILDAVPVPREDPRAFMVILQVEYVEGEPDTYAFPVGFALGQDGGDGHALARLAVMGARGDEEGILYEATADAGFTRLLPEIIGRRRQFQGEVGEIVGIPGDSFRRVFNGDGGGLEPRLSRGEQSNTAILYGEKGLLKLFRRLEPGPNPDWEILRFLSSHGFPHIPPLAGAMEYRPDSQPAITLAILQGFVKHETDGWRYTLDAIDHYFERVLAHRAEGISPAPSTTSASALLNEAIPPLADALLGPYKELASLLGRRTAELHLVLASDPSDPDFAPEPFSDHYRQALYYGMNTLATQAFQLLRQRMNSLPTATRDEARRVLGLETEVRKRFLPIRTRKLNANRIRHHGDYHLGQVLFTGKDFVILDFEGEPARPLSERRIKRSPLRDVAGMLRSFHYASAVALSDAPSSQHARDATVLAQWAQRWQLWVGSAFLKSYVATAENASFLPLDREELRIMIDAFLMEKAVYELRYELNNRPTWVGTPLQGILHLVGAPS